MSKNVPTQVIIGPYRYSVEMNGEEAWDWSHNGRAFYRSRRISLNDKMSPTEIPQTMLHEILHTLGEAFEIKYWTNHEYAAKLPDGGDQIDIMATALLMFMRSNKEVVNWLLDDA